jgi:3,4-dihydroxy 2-butanone 4-phosphate synthase / GTP cyclohydrolase II
MQIQKLEKIKKNFLSGKPVIVFDAENRENEADFIIPSGCLTPKTVNFMISKGKGLLCTAITEERQKQLALNLMTNSNNSQFYTNFTVSVDLNRPEITTGITAMERFLTIQALADENFLEKDFNKPGHIFPLVAKKDLLKARKGHTEATIELALQAGYKPCGALIEILNEEGDRANLEYCQKLSKKYNLEILNIEDF